MITINTRIHYTTSILAIKTKTYLQIHFEIDVLKKEGEECGSVWDGSSDFIEIECETHLECKIKIDPNLADAQFGTCVQKEGKCAGYDKISFYSQCNDFRYFKTII